MNIGLIGSGGREHALCQKIHESKLIKKIICFPGNAGTAKIAKNIKADILNFREIHQLVKFHKIDLVIVGPEEPLVKGLVDYLRKKGLAEFPDAVTSRGAKHIQELVKAGKKGYKIYVCFVVQRDDCTKLSIAKDIDQNYFKLLSKAIKKKLNIICYDCKFLPKGIKLNKKIKIII